MFGYIRTHVCNTTTHSCLIYGFGNLSNFLFVKVSLNEKRLNELLVEIIATIHNTLLTLFKQYEVVTTIVEYSTNRYLPSVFHKLDLWTGLVCMGVLIVFNHRPAKITITQTLSLLHHEQ